MTDLDIAVAKMLLRCGYAQHRIASLFDVNQGRIAEISTGERGGDIQPAILLTGRDGWSFGPLLKDAAV